MSKSPDVIESVLEKGQGLSQSLKMRQIVMVGVGGTIGTGMFLGTGHVMHIAGPGGAIFAYLLGGLIMWFMMLCMGELSSAMPSSGTVQAYATELINPAMGFTIGWINWLGCALTITAQIVASSIIMKDLIPPVPIAVWLVGFSLLLFGANALTVNQFGELAFWFSSLKIVLVIAFSIVGFGIITGAVGQEAVGFHNYIANGGFFPKGVGIILVATLTTIYSFGGSDNTAMSAGELKNKKDIPKAINYTTWILIASYIIPVIILVAIFPWTEANLLGSPFAKAFEYAGINGAAVIVNILVLTSALSSGNYFVYACTRYLWSLSKYDQAPKVFSKVNKNQVPMNALMFSMLFAVLSIIASFVAEDTVYWFIISVGAAGNIVVYSTVCICQMLFRRKYLASGGDLKDLNYRTPLFPIVPIIVVVAYSAVLIATVADPGQRVTTIFSLCIYVVIYIASHFYAKKRGTTAANIKMD